MTDFPFPPSPPYLLLAIVFSLVPTAALGIAIVLWRVRKKKRDRGSGLP